MEKSFFVPIEGPSIEFERHLNVDDNSRIFLSGRFGIGKSTFIKDFFNKHFKEKRIINLSPINYQVSNNEDVFEYIKYDILFQLIENNNLKLNEDINDKIIFYEYLKNQGLKDGYNVSLNFLSALPKIGHAFKGIEGITNFLKSYENFKSKNKNNDRSEILKFINQIETKGIKEFDFISEIINNTIENGDYFLIIDDLDRIDPEHIFRLLNIFSSHFNIKRNENKFGFEKIILIGDINNIESIYYHRYGNSADISGYLDKFYSDSVFYFSNDDAIISNVGKFLKQYGQNNKELSKSLKHIDVELAVIISDLIRNKSFTIRKFWLGIKNFKNKVDLDYIYIKAYENRTIPASQFIVIHLYVILENLFGFNSRELERALKNSAFTNKKQRIYERLIDELILLDPNIKFFSSNNQSITLEGMNIEIEEILDYWYINESNRKILKFKEGYKKNELINNFYQYFYEGYLNYKNKVYNS